MFTIKELYSEYQQFGRISSIENVSGVYRVYKPEGFQVRIKESTDAIEEYNGKSLLYSTERLEWKWSQICEATPHGCDVLYIGKADSSKNRGLRSRVTELVMYSYVEVKNHRGGRALWQIENNKQLRVEIIECENPKDVERSMINDYKEQHGVYPFANWQ